MAVAVLSSTLLAPGAGTAHAEGVLRLVWFDLVGLAARAESVAQAEAAALAARMGAMVSWRRGEPGEVRRRDEVWVVLIGEGPRRGPSRLVLGTTLRGPRVAPLVWVRVPNVQATLAISGRRGRPLAADELRRLGVAVGRVIAHELVHALVPSQPHGSGLMSDSFTARQLDAATMAIEPGVARAFGAALRGGPDPFATAVLTAGRVSDDATCACPSSSALR